MGELTKLLELAVGIQRKEPDRTTEDPHQQNYIPNISYIIYNYNETNILLSRLN